jgi:coiled-coil and C2 domain-containing protein 2A
MPLNMCFTEIGDVIQRVKATGIHETQNPDAQFALAVSIFPYPNHVLSVWVYFAMFIPRMNVIK